MINHFNVSVSPFGSLPDGGNVSRYELSNPSGMRVGILDFGGIIQSIEVPDCAGEFADVALGFSHLEPYLDKSPYIGALVGRYANRIAGGKFSLQGKQYELAINNGPNHLHGGEQGFDKRLWQARAESTDDAAVLVLSLVSADGDQGYPGEVAVEVTYSLHADNSLAMAVKAKTDAPTLLNMTQHSYFNLSGEPDVLNHEVQIFADRYTPVNSDLIPTGELAPVADTPLDFTSPVKIGARIENDHPQLQFGAGYDHNYVLNKARLEELSLAASAYSEETGRKLELYTTEPGLQFYSGNFLDGELEGKNGVIARRSGFCLEPQHFPDSPNQAHFPSVELNPGQEYTSQTIFKFSLV